jgi:glycosyltransferase involved in cell wall biosynthesis
VTLAATDLLNTNPLVTVLIPAFNQELPFLKECVDSALNQSFRNLEVVVSDNRSTNGTAELLRSYADERLRVVSPNSFLSMNENFAFCASHARGQFISFLSSDDLLLPHAIQMLFDHIERDPNVVFGCGNIYSARRLPSDSNRTKFLIRAYGQRARYLSSQDAQAFFFPWSMGCTWMAGDIIRRAAYERTGGFSKCDMLTTGDVWLTKKLLEQGGFFCLDEPLALFRTRSLIKPEVDRDRRLFDFADLLVLQAGGSAPPPSAVRKFKQGVSLAYRLGSVPHPSGEALERSQKIFLDLHRYDLVRVIDLQLSHPRWLKTFGSAVRLVDLSRRAAHRLHTYFTVTRAVR